MVMHLMGSNNGDISSTMEMANNAAWGVSNGILQRLVDLLYASQQLGNKQSRHGNTIA